MTNFRVYNTGDISSQFTNTLLYGLAGAGKTPMAASMPDVIVISAEPGLKSLTDYRISYIQARNESQLKDAHKWVLGSNEARKYQSVFVDSISAISENILADEKAKNRDPRRFSPATTAATMEIVTSFQSIPGHHVCMACKAVVTTTETNTIPASSKTWIEPQTVVPKLGPMLPYHFDFVIYMSRHRKADGSVYAAFTCDTNDLCHARNRGDKLALYEPADLGYIIRKSNGVK